MLRAWGLFTTQIKNMSTKTHNYDVIVIGSGLAGLTSSVKLLESGLSVALIEKAEKMGGNSIKASSGINGVPTKYQKPEDKDTIEEFYKDTIRSGKGLSDSGLAQKLTQDSAKAINWLSEECGIDLSIVARLGGHSFARTHRGSSNLPPGFAIVSTLMKKVQLSEKVDLYTLTRFLDFIQEDKKVVGIKVEDEKESENRDLYAKNIILATGGVCADLSGEDSMIKRYRPDLLDYPQTNSPLTTGDGQKIAELSLGANLIQMDQIQVHPTGFIQLKSEDTIHNKSKFLCGELIRSIGGILISPLTGKRFVNELTTRDEVTKSVLASCGEKPVAAIVVSEEDYEKAPAHIKFYMSQALMFQGTASDLAEKFKEVLPHFQLTASTLADGISEYGEQIGNDIYKRSHFGASIGETFYFGFITPVLHFSMGGIETNQESQVKTQKGVTIPNVYAIGEVSGGVHGANRLGGSSLLECVVFGTRVSELIIRESRKRKLDAK